MKMEEIDPLGVESDEEKRTPTPTIPGAGWENEALAQVRVRSLRGHTQAVTACQFVENDERIISSSWDGTVGIWSAETGNNLCWIRPHSNRCSDVRISHDGQKFVSGGWDKRVKLIDIESSGIIWEKANRGVVTTCDYSSDSKIIVSASDISQLVSLWDERSGDLIREIGDLHSTTITSVHFSPKNDRIATTSMDKTCKLYDLRTFKKTVTLEGHSNIVSSASFSQDERHLATSSWDKNVCVWDISTGQYRLQGPEKIEKAHQGSVSCCKFSEDGLLLVTGGYDSGVCVWDMEGENILQSLRLQGHGDWVECVDISSDKNFLISGSKDCTIRLWNVEDSDSIPVVLESKKAIVGKMLQCSRCGKPFSIAQVQSKSEVDICVFCRLQE